MKLRRIVLTPFISAFLISTFYAQSWFKAGSLPGSYNMGGDPTVGYDSPGGGYIVSNTSPIDGFGTWMTQIPVQDYLGKAIKMTAFVKTINAEEEVALWVRVDGAQSSLTFDNMYGRQIIGTSSWKNYEIVIDVPVTAKSIFCGILMAGTGEAYVYGMKWELVPQTWEYQYIGNSDIYSIEAIDENTVWAGGFNGYYMRTIDGGSTWTTGKVPNTSNFNFSDIAAVNANTAYFAGSNVTATAGRIYKTSNGGSTWTMQFQKIGKGVSFGAIAFWDENNGIALSDPLDGKFLIVKTSDGGVNWHEVPAINIPPPLPDELASFEINGGSNLVVSGNKQAWFGTGYSKKSNNPMRIFKTSDMGQTWQVVNTDLNNTGSSFHGVSSIIFIDTLVGFASSTGSPGNKKNTFVKTLDSGKTWSLAPSFPEENSTRLIFVPKTNGANLFIPAIGGYYHSKNLGETWQHKKVSSTQKISILSFASPEKGWSAGIGMSAIFKISIAKDLTNILDKSLHDLKAPQLNQNYPNPFNLSTNIDFYCPLPGRVSLKIYNQKGQEVAILISGFLSAGKHQVTWKPGELAKGIYFYQFKAGKYAASRKMLMIR